MINRFDLRKKLNTSIQENHVTTLLGPRQCGKTTIAKTIRTPSPVHYYDLENPADRSGLVNPLTALGNSDGLVILDEIQWMPELYEILCVLVDGASHQARYLILGSASPRIIRDVSETVAGRIGFVDMGGFNLKEVSPDNWEKLWLRGGFPRSYLAADENSSFRWRDNFARTFLERDLRLFGFSIHPESMRRFWIMVAHYHGQIWNAAEFARISQSVGKWSILKRFPPLNEKEKGGSPGLLRVFSFRRVAGHCRLPLSGGAFSSLEPHLNKDDAASDRHECEPDRQRECNVLADLRPVMQQARIAVEAVHPQEEPGHHLHQHQRCYSDAGVSMQLP